MRAIPHLLLLAAMLALSACGGSDRPTYSGREESTAGVPGFSPDGKRKLHPTVKLGQSYTVGGKTYVPRYQPDYVEEGMASWYGPGFHGGKTANGERFSTHDRTAAHTTLPMPSIVKVTYLKTGKSTYVRINDRGPFAHNRIIDLSRAAAEDIGMLGDGVGKVRVEYMVNETNKFAELLASGRDPQSIDLAGEVLGKTPSDTDYADTRGDSVWERLNPISSAQAEEPSSLPYGQPISTPVADVNSVRSNDLPPPSLPPATTTPIAAPDVAPVAITSPPAQLPKPEPPPNIPAGITAYVQVGAFATETNARAMQQRFASLAEAAITPANVGGIPIYRVRLGPFVSHEAAIEMLERAQQMGAKDAKLVSEYH